MKVYILLESGIFDYEQYTDILLVTTNIEKVKVEYEKAKQRLIEHFDDDYENEDIIKNEFTDKTQFEIHLEGYAVDDSKKIEIIEKEVE